MLKKAAFLFVYALMVFLTGIIIPRPVLSNLLVDELGCLNCHELGEVGSQDDTLHGTHKNCADCHEGTPSRGTVKSATCIQCHPFTDPGKCELVSLHETSVSYDPPGLSCLDCHIDCGTETTTTTTITTGPPSIKGTRWEVLLVGPFQEGCRSTTMNLRQDNVITFDCLDGFGSYTSLGGVFTAVYWSNNYYNGYGLGMVISGVSFNPYLFAGGVAYFSNIMSPVILTGYIK